MKLIKRNEQLGRQIEELVAQDFPNCTIPYQHIRGPYDLETDDKIIKVKSCRLRTKGVKSGKYRHHQATQTGRFMIFVNSHSKLGEEAELRDKQPFYLFILYEMNDNRVNIIDKKMMHWQQVGYMLMEYPAYTRKSGSCLAQIPQTAIFQQTRLERSGER